MSNHQETLPSVDEMYNKDSFIRTIFNVEMLALAKGVNLDEAVHLPYSWELSLEQMQTELDVYKQLWKKPENMKKFQAIFDSEKFDLFKDLGIEQAVCVGLGTLNVLQTWPRDEAKEEFRAQDRELKGKHYRIASPGMQQLAFLTIFLELLKENTNYKIPDVYLQDPAWDEVEEEFVRTLGYKVLHYNRTGEKNTGGAFTGEGLVGEDDEALKKARENKATFVFAPNLPLGVLEGYFIDDELWPSIWFGNSFEWVMDLMDDLDTPINRKLKPIVGPFVKATDICLMVAVLGDLWETSSGVRYRKRTVT